MQAELNGCACVDLAMSETAPHIFSHTQGAKRGAIFSTQGSSLSHSGCSKPVVHVLLTPAFRFMTST